jgi:hypothetical protein
MTHGWVIANRFSAQSAYPLQIYQRENVQLADGIFQNYLPNLVSDVPIYLHGSAADVNGQPVPGNWRLNPAAFALVPTDPTSGLPIRHGTLELCTRSRLLHAEHRNPAQFPDLRAAASSLPRRSFQYLEPSKSGFS